MSRLEKLARMLTSNLGASAPFDDAMLARALRATGQPNIPEQLVAAFLGALADAFDGAPGPHARIRAGRKGRPAAIVTALGVTDEAIAVHDFVTDAANLALAGTQENLIEKVVNGDWPGSKAMSRGKVTDHLKEVRAAKARLRTSADQGRAGQQSPDNKRQLTDKTPQNSCLLAGPSGK